MVPKDNDYEYTKEDLDNHSNQKNDNNDAYWQSRGESERPEDWKIKQKKTINNSTAKSKSI